MKTNTQSFSLKAALPAILAIGILTASAAGLAGCTSTGGASAGGTHEMGGPKSQYRMSDESMPGHAGH